MPPTAAVGSVGEVLLLNIYDVANMLKLPTDKIKAFNEFSKVYGFYDSPIHVTSQFSYTCWLITRSMGVSLGYINNRSLLTMSNSIYNFM